MDEQTLANTPPALLRLTHAEYFLAEYVRHSGPPVDSYWLMVGYFDAFLFALASVHDMAPQLVRNKLDDIGVFRFFKVLRNVTAHHSVLAATIAGNKFQRPFSRHMSISIGGSPNDSSRLVFRLDILHDILNAVEKEWPPEKKNLNVARDFINTLEARKSHVFLEEIMSEAVTAAKSVLSHV